MKIAWMAAARGSSRLMFAALIVGGLIAPFLAYPTFLMKVLCFALFASAFNLLLGFVGLLSFGHAAFFAFGAYVCGYLCKNLGAPPEVFMSFFPLVRDVLREMAGAAWTERMAAAWDEVLAEAQGLLETA